MSEKYLWKSDIFSKDIIRWSAYLLYIYISVNYSFAGVFQRFCKRESITLPVNELNLCLQKLQPNTAINVI